MGAAEVGDADGVDDPLLLHPASARANPEPNAVATRSFLLKSSLVMCGNPSLFRVTGWWAHKPENVCACPRSTGKIRLRQQHSLTNTVIAFAEPPRSALLPHECDDEAVLPPGQEVVEHRPARHLFVQLRRIGLPL